MQPLLPERRARDSTTHAIDDSEASFSCIDFLQQCSGIRGAVGVKSRVVHDWEISCEIPESTCWKRRTKHAICGDEQVRTRGRGHLKFDDLINQL